MDKVETEATEHFDEREKQRVGARYPWLFSVLPFIFLRALCVLWGEMLFCPETEIDPHRGTYRFQASFRIHYAE